MSAIGLAEFLRRDPDADGGRQLTTVHEGHYAPGFWTALVARACSNGIGSQGITFRDDAPRGYASAIGLELALDGKDVYAYERKNTGRNYSPLVALRSAEATDQANSDIANCIRRIFPEKEHRAFVGSLCEVVGDLHDNVWSHGKKSGFSMAQKWRKPKSTGHYFEFALADCGIGFLRELHRVGLDIPSHAQAIEWCLVKGHSSKRVRPADPWAQRLPPDAMGNPMGAAGRIVESENHHLGLGLGKLIDLVREFRGELWIATGDDLFHANPKLETEHRRTRVQWDGVAIACRFDTSMIKGRRPKPVDDVTEALVELLGGDNGNDI